MPTDWHDLNTDAEDPELTADTTEFRDLLAKAAAKNKKKRFYKDEDAASGQKRNILEELLNEGPSGEYTNEIVLPGGGDVDTGESGQDPEGGSSKRLFAPLSEQASKELDSKRNLRALHLEAENFDKSVYERFVHIFRPGLRQRAQQALQEKFQRDAFVPQIAVIVMFLLAANIYQMHERVEKSKRAQAQMASSLPAASPPPSAPPVAHGTAAPAGRTASQLQSAEGKEQLDPLKADQQRADEMRLRLIEQPDDDQQRKQLARLLIKLDRPEAAVEQYYILERKNALTETERLELGKALVAASKLDDAWRYFAHLLSLCKTNEERLHVYDAWINGQIAVSNQAEVIKLCQQAQEHASSEAERNHFKQFIAKMQKISAADFQHPLKRTAVSGKSDMESGG